jgi:hypothetical protein
VDDEVAVAGQHRLADGVDEQALDVEVADGPVRVLRSPVVAIGTSSKDAPVRAR